MFKQIVTPLAFFMMMLASSSLYADVKSDVKHARAIIERLQEDIFEKVRLSKGELSKNKADFQEYYQAVVVPRLKKPVTKYWRRFDSLG